ncbi:MAG: hypothetical protein IK015_08450 [Treponema sp.]|nr:hypothetical protein [Treponema sp.]
MKNIRIKFTYLTLTLATITIFLLASCYQPSPLYGTWSDNQGNKLILSSDNSYTAIIKDSNGNTNNYNGSYTVLENIISFSRTDGNMNTEWDIRGGILYLKWLDSSGKEINLNLYHTA